MSPSHKTCIKRPDCSPYRLSWVKLRRVKATHRHVVRPTKLIINQPWALWRWYLTFGTNPSDLWFLVYLDNGTKWYLSEVPREVLSNLSFLINQSDRKTWLLLSNVLLLFWDHFETSLEPWASTSPIEPDLAWLRLTDTDKGWLILTEANQFWAWLT